MKEWARPRQIDLIYDEAVLRSAVRSFIWRRMVADEKLLWIIGAAMAVLCLWSMRSGQSPWLIWLTGSATLLPVIFVTVVWLLWHRRKSRQLRAMPSRRARMLLGNDGIALRSEAGETMLPWTGITEVWERPAYWMVFLAPNQFVTIPLKGVAADDLAFFRRSLDAATGA